MDIKQYIESGIIDRYVIGAVSDQERREVECMSSIYPELKEELSSLQGSIESYVESISVTPPAQLKQAILERIKTEEQDSEDEERGGRIVSLKSDTASQDETDDKIIPLQSKSRLKWIAAASIIPLIGLGVLYLGERNTRVQVSEQLATVEERTAQEFEDSLKGLRNELNENETYQALILDESTREVVLAGTELSPESQVRVFWSEEKQQFMLLSDRLPTPISSKQYQLWAIADGVPVDLGMLDKESPILAPQNIDLDNIEAFAITLEKNGGVIAPTMDQMYVVGAV